MKTSHALAVGAIGGSMANTLKRYISPWYFIFGGYLGRNSIFSGNQKMFGTKYSFYKGVKWINPFLTIILPAAIIFFIPLLLIVIPYTVSEKKKKTSWMWAPKCLKYVWHNKCKEEVDRETLYNECLPELNIEQFSRRSRKSSSSRRRQSKAKKVCKVHSDTEVSISSIWWVAYIFIWVFFIIIAIISVRIAKYIWYAKMYSINDQDDVKKFIKLIGMADITDVI